LINESDLDEMEILTSVSPFKASETELFTYLAHYAETHDTAFALWRLPDSSTKHLLLSHKPQVLSSDFALEQLLPGYIFSPFDRKKDTVFLPADFLFHFEHESLKNPSSTLEKRSVEWLENEFVSGEKVRAEKGTTIPNVTSAKDADTFVALINRCIEEIERGTVEKIVPSRTKQVELPADFDIVDAFQRLCDRYSHALISFVSIPGIGSWLTATPELLVSIENKHIFRTVALAGTKRFEEGMSLRNVAWTQKEIEEQALVERYIISCFKSIRLREYEEHGPKTIVAGNVIHLKTEFAVDLKATNFPNLGSIMLKLLHPTSAVCGMPLNHALDFLKKNEGYDRSFYAGYLGPVNIENNINIFVNLRCMQIDGNLATLYAGAGVTIDSAAEEELEETEIKFNTLLNVIFS
jgi:isochorismate synthase